MTVLRLLVAVCLTEAAYPARGADRQPMPASLTVQQAVRLALSANPQLRRARAAVEEARARHGLARAVNRPNFSVSGFQSVQTLNLRALGIDSSTFQGAGDTPIPERFGPFGTFDGRMELETDILNLPSRFQQRAERLRVESKEAETENARELIAVQAVTQYIEALRAQAFEATAAQQLASARALWTITTDRFEQGVSSGLDRRRARARMTAAQQLVYEAQAVLEAAKLTLAHTLHTEITASYELADIALYFDSGVAAPGEALAAALRARPDYLAAKAAVESARMNLRAAQFARLPQLTFHADYGRSGRTMTTTVPVYRVQGNVVIPIYFGGRATALRTGAQAALEEAEAALEAIESEVEMQLRVALSAFNSARMQTQAAEETVKLSKEEVDLSLTRFQGGVTDNSEVVIAQERLAQAEQGRIRALYNLNMARVALHRAGGNAVETYGGAAK